MSPSCNHIRQQHEGHLLDCATPRCIDGANNPKITLVRMLPMRLIFEPIEIMDSVAAKLYHMERMKISYTNSWMWYHKDQELRYISENLYEITFPEHVDI